MQATTEERTTSAQLLRNIIQNKNAETPTLVGTLQVTKDDLALPKPYQLTAGSLTTISAGKRGERHRGDEATQRKTHTPGAIGEALVGRLLSNQKGCKVAPLHEWQPFSNADLLFESNDISLRADFKCCDRATFALNEYKHLTAAPKCYLTVQLQGEAEAFSLAKVFIVPATT